VKEALNNAVSHGKPSQVLLKFVVSENEFTIHVQDNGRGFDPGIVSHGNGLANLRERMLKINGQCQIRSSVQGGTMVILQIPMT
jgi:signal transduction histidine kinase